MSFQQRLLKFKASKTPDCLTRESVIELYDIGFKDSNDKHAKMIAEKQLKGVDMEEEDKKVKITVDPFSFKMVLAFYDNGGQTTLKNINHLYFLDEGVLVQDIDDFNALSIDDKAQVASIRLTMWAPKRPNDSVPGLFVGSTYRISWCTGLHLYFDALQANANSDKITSVNNASLALLDRENRTDESDDSDVESDANDNISVSDTPKRKKMNTRTDNAKKCRKD